MSEHQNNDKWPTEADIVKRLESWYNRGEPEILPRMTYKPAPKLEYVPGTDKPKPIDIFDQPIKPPMCWPGGDEFAPGYRVCDVQKVLDAEDFEHFCNEVCVCGEVDGEPIVYALDYVRWVLCEEGLLDR